MTGTHVAWRTPNSTYFGSPLIHGQEVFYVSKVGVASSVSLAGGDLRWQHRVSSGCWASPIGHSDRVYFFATDGVTTVLKTGTKEAVELARNELRIEGRLYGVAAADGGFLLRTGRELIRVGDVEKGGTPRQPVSTSAAGSAHSQ